MLWDLYPQCNMAETDENPTSRERSGYAENVVCCSLMEFSRRGPNRTLHGG
jgi:hypothetical protein